MSGQQDLTSHVRLLETRLDQMAAIIEDQRRRIEDLEAGANAVLDSGISASQSLSSAGSHAKRRYRLPGLGKLLGERDDVLGRLEAKVAAMETQTRWDVVDLRRSISAIVEIVVQRRSRDG